jgi:glycerol-3-phosphate acyltransferase PlsY
MVWVWKTLAAGAMAYALGSISFALLVTRWKAGIDVRSVGSGHASGTNTMRAAGWGAGILVAVLDFGKGYLAVWLAQQLGGVGLTTAVAAGAVVIGHCWPIFAGFRGGMGVGSGSGALLAIWPLGFILAVGLGVSLQLIVHHSARANVFTGILLTPLWALFGAPWPQLVTAVAVGLVVSLRALSDWRRVYSELWLDREL